DRGKKDRRVRQGLQHAIVARQCRVAPSSERQQVAPIQIGQREIVRSARLNAPHLPSSHLYEKRRVDMVFISSLTINRLSTNPGTIPETGFDVSLNGIGKRQLRQMARQQGV